MLCLSPGIDNPVTFKENQKNKVLLSLKKGKCFDRVRILASRRNNLYLNHCRNNEFCHLMLSGTESNCEFFKEKQQNG